MEDEATNLPITLLFANLVYIRGDFRKLADQCDFKELALDVSIPVAA
jgi:hypothetical protein